MVIEIDEININKKFAIAEINEPISASPPERNHNLLKVDEAPVHCFNRLSCLFFPLEHHHAPLFHSLHYLDVHNLFIDRS